MGYNGYTDKKRASNKKYMEQLSRRAFYLTKEENEDLKARADKSGKSVNSFIRNALGYQDTPMQNDNYETCPEHKEH
ncbi:plasmid mobilization protein [Butyrivibrio hungatei]|uniref:Uncharacterized protein n=1 Tax=Butyrivibrio hungatei TaxID=185008 RepID=A0A1D9P6G5_9FIRM|nr:hypothetical protein [Butyrivibrio hungatei]AOZ97904.1 hypothetical protein bhn_II105 [Butyrivibrio hungatei]